MALNSTIGGGGDPSTQSGSMQSSWTVAHTNANVTADTGTVPSAIVQAGAGWVLINHPVTTIRLRLRHTIDDATTTTPIVTIWAFSGPATSAGVPTDYGQCHVAGSVTLDNTATFDDGVYDYCGISDATDLLGATGYLLQVTTAGVGSAVAQIQSKALN